VGATFTTKSEAEEALLALLEAGLEEATLDVIHPKKDALKGNGATHVAVTARTRGGEAQHILQQHGGKLDATDAGSLI
jgi:hypothetical protein